MRIPALIALLVATTTSGGLSLTAQALPSAPVASRFLTDVSDARLAASVRHLVALGPRMGGTRSGAAAAEWIARAFRTLGLRTEIVDDQPGFAFDVDAWEVRLGESVLLSAWPYTFSTAIQPARRAPLVRGAPAEAARAGAWRDRILYLERWSPEAYQAVLALPPDVRPIAILARADGEDTRDPDAAAIDTVPVFARPEVPDATSTVPVFGIGARDGAIVEAAIEGGTEATVTLDARIVRGTPRTVVATLPGRPGEGYYLVTAHADSDAGGPGADDNASGVAVVLELARLFKAAADAGTALPFSLQFATWGAEYESARAYVARERGRLEHCLGVINIDQAGTGAEREAVYAEGNDVPWNRDLLRAFESVGQQHLGARGLWPEFATTPTQGGTDAYAFLPRAFKGDGILTQSVPAITVYSAAWGRAGVLRQTPGWRTNTGDASHVLIDYSRVYHSSGDTPDNTTAREPQNMRRVVQWIGLTLERLAEASRQ